MKALTAVILASLLLTQSCINDAPQGKSQPQTVEEVRGYISGSWCRSSDAGYESYVFYSNGKYEHKLADPRADGWENVMSGIYQIKKSKYTDDKTEYLYISAGESYLVLNKSGILVAVTLAGYNNSIISEDRYGLELPEYKANGLAPDYNKYRHSDCDF